MNGSETRKLYGTFRCPVCGHRDGAEVEGTREGEGVVSCSYCDTTLELQGSRSAGRFEARVSRESMRG